MSFMQPETYSGLYWEIDGQCGTDFVPFDIVSTTVGIGDVITDDHDSFAELCELLADYTNNTESQIFSITVSDGVLARLSASGYLDCTDWMPVESVESAISELADLYGDDIADESDE